MPVFNRQRTLREQFFHSRALFGRNRLEDGDDRATRKNSFLASTPASLKGSLLNNRLDNPLFRPFSSFTTKKISLRRKKSKRSMTEVDSDEEEDDAEENESVVSNEAELEEEEKSSKVPPIKLGKFRRKNNKTKTKREGESRFGTFLFYKKSNLAKKSSSNTTTRSRLFSQRISSDSNTSNSSNSSAYESEQEVDLLTKLEDSTARSNSTDRDASSKESESFLLYTDKGQAVRLQYFFDYLLITPVSSRTLIGYRSNRALKNAKPKIVYYEDLASWTNNDDCLRLIHIKNKHTAEQTRSEIKLYVNKKKVLVSPEELNELLKDHVSVLLAEKLNCDAKEARKHLERNATDAEVNRVVQKIDRNGQKFIAHSYTKDLLHSSNYQVLNI